MLTFVAHVFSTNKSHLAPFCAASTANRLFSTCWHWKFKFPVVRVCRPSLAVAEQDTVRWGFSCLVVLTGLEHTQHVVSRKHQRTVKAGWHCRNIKVHFLVLLRAVSEDKLDLRHNTKVCFIGKRRLLKCPPLGSGANNLLVFSTEASFAWCCHLEEQEWTISRRGGVTKGQFETVPKWIFDSAEVLLYLFFFIFITSNNLGQPWMAQWKLDEEEGEWIYRGCWCEKWGSVLVRLQLLFAFPSKSPFKICIWSNICFGESIFLHKWLRPDRNVNKKLPWTQINPKSTTISVVQHVA